MAGIKINVKSQAELRRTLEEIVRRLDAITIPLQGSDTRYKLELKIDGGHPAGELVWTEVT